MYVHPLNSKSHPLPITSSQPTIFNQTRLMLKGPRCLTCHIISIRFHSSSVTSDQGHFEGIINLFSQGPALRGELKQLVWIRIIEFRILARFSKLAVPPRKFKVSPGKVPKSVWQVVNFLLSWRVKYGPGMKHQEVKVSSAKCYEYSSYNLLIYIWIIALGRRTLRHGLVPLRLNEVDLGDTPSPGFEFQTVVAQTPLCFNCNTTYKNVHIYTVTTTVNIYIHVYICIYILSYYLHTIDAIRKNHISRIGSPTVSACWCQATSSIA